MKLQTRETVELGALWGAWWVSHGLADFLQLVVLGLSVVGGTLYVISMFLKIRAQIRKDEGEE